MKKSMLAIALAASALATGNTFASSHREAPMITGTPKLDGCDFYMFNSYETGRSNFVTFVADYLPLQDPFGGPNYFQLETNGIYEIEIDNNGDAQEDITFQFQFFSTNRNFALPIGPAGSQVTNEIPLTVTVGQVGSNNTAAINSFETYTVKMITGNRRTGVAQYLTNAADGTIVFTKPIDNIGNKTIPNYNSYANQYIYNVNIPGCPTPGRLFVGQRKDPFVVNLGETFDMINLNPFEAVNAGRDSLATKNVTSLVLEVPKSCLTNSSSPVIAGWTTASQFQGTNIMQVSRLGQPLVNEVVIGLNDKDTFNTSEPKNDAQFAKYVTNPTLPAIIQLLFGSAGIVAPTNFPRADLVEVFLTGIPTLNQTTATAEMLRLNTTTPTLPAAAQNNLGVIAGDVAGFPNGRRPGDDVVDIALRVMMGKLLSTNDAPSGQLPYTDGAYVDANVFQQVFPYINPPLAGSPNDLSFNVTVQSSSSAGGPFTSVPATFNGTNSMITTANGGASKSFYRTASDQSGISLGQPKVVGPNVVIPLQTPSN